MGKRTSGYLGAILLIALAIAPSLPTSRDPNAFSATDFKKLLQTLADGWNQGNARKSADCFARDAVYTVASLGLVKNGREALYEYFGGDKGIGHPVVMTWHYVVFDRDLQLGAGEFTFEMNGRGHGIVLVKLREGKISNWREYFTKSDLDWAAFEGDNKFRD